MGGLLGEAISHPRASHVFTSCVFVSAPRLLANLPQGCRDTTANGLFVVLPGWEGVPVSDFWKRSHRMRKWRSVVPPEFHFLL